MWFSQISMVILQNFQGYSCQFSVVILVLFDSLKIFSGRYREAIVSLNGKWTFDSETFLNSSPGNMKPFLETVLHLQSFEQFIDERVEYLNSGRSLDRDPFEIEVDLLMAKKTKKKDKVASL